MASCPECHGEGYLCSECGAVCERGHACESCGGHGEKCFLCDGTGEADDVD